MCRCEYRPPHRLQVSSQTVIRHGVRERIVPARQDPLSDIYGDPARIEEATFPVGDERTTLTKQLHSMGKGLRKLHGAAVVPECRVRTFRRVVMQDEEIAHALVLEIHHAG